MTYSQSGMAKTRSAAVSRTQARAKNKHCIRTRLFPLTEVDVSERAAPDLAPEAVLVPDSQLHGDEGELGGHKRETVS